MALESNYAGITTLHIYSQMCVPRYTAVASLESLPLKAMRYYKMTSNRKPSLFYLPFVREKNL